jgi:hypothetical protein
LKELLTEYGDIFSIDSEDYGLIYRVYHLIDVVETRPISEILSSIPPEKQVNVDEMFEDMQRRGVIEESGSLWSSPVVPSGRSFGTCASA